jgi:hypothetical protein
MESSSLQRTSSSPVRQSRLPGSRFTQEATAMLLPLHRSAGMSSGAFNDSAMVGRIIAAARLFGNYPK